ncbi:MAG: hypothetical protein NC308_05810 [Clostridium sp.]|nr:hypothetical protein [Bacteroides sp.]MCM1198385.1 hypothetical protein [Clostridium sp.]
MGRFCSVLLMGMAVMLAIFSCSRPLSTETFVKASGRDEAGRYHFVLDMTDSLCAYSIRFYTRADCHDKEFRGIGDLVVDVRLEAPSGRKYAERVYIRKNDFASGRGLAKDYNMPYRTGFRPSEYGKWNMYLTLPSVDYVDSGIRGMGVCLSKQIENNGKR